MEIILSQTVKNESETKLLVEQFCKKLEAIPNFTIFFQGALGAGKTFFVQQLLKHFGINTPINSPTFTYVQEYNGDQKNFAHFDLYRLESDEQFLEKGFGEIIEDDTWNKLVEWPQKISDDLQEEFSGTSFWVTIEHQPHTTRNITITTTNTVKSV